MQYFRESLRDLVRDVFVGQKRRNNPDIPDEFLINHITGSFVEMLLLWLLSKEKYSSVELDNYLRAVIEPII